MDKFNHSQAIFLDYSHAKRIPRNLNLSVQLILITKLRPSKELNTSSKRDSMLHPRNQGEDGKRGTEERRNSYPRPISNHTNVVTGEQDA